MKKVYLKLDGLINDKIADDVSNTLNDLSGVVAADVSLKEQTAFAYAGDRLSIDVIIDAVGKTGCRATILNEEYLNIPLE